MAVRQLEMMLSKYAMVLQKLYWFAYLQLLWMLFTLCGLIIFGLFPATYALLTVVRESEELSSREAFRKFKNTFVSSFKPINKIGLLWQVMVLLLASNLLILPVEYVVVRVAVVVVLGLTILGVIHFYQYYEMDKASIFQIKRAFSFVFLQPRKNVGYMLIFALLLIAIRFFPGISFFYAVSSCAYFVAKIGNVNEILSKGN